MQIVQEIKYLEQRQQNRSKIIQELFAEILNVQQSLIDLKTVPKQQLRQSKSTLILISANQDSPQPKITRNASLSKDDFLEQCIKNIQQANKQPEISNTSSPPKISNRIKGRLEKHIPELKTQEAQIPIPTSTLQSIFTSTNSPQQKLSKLMQMDEFQTKEIRNKNQIFNIHEEDQLQQ